MQAFSTLPFYFTSDVNLLHWGRCGSRPTSLSTSHEKFATIRVITLKPQLCCKLLNLIDRYFIFISKSYKICMKTSTKIYISGCYKGLFRIILLSNMQFFAEQYYICLCIYIFTYKQANCFQISDKTLTI